MGRSYYNGGVSFPVRAITLDLDDTLWPFAPIGVRIEQALHDWMLQFSPRTAEQFPIETMRALNRRVIDENPQLGHDMSELRRMTLRHALQHSGSDPDLCHPAYDAFFAARNQVECYVDSIEALQRIAARLPVAALTNGNADLEMIGLSEHFVFNLAAREHGAAKPDPGIFHAACERLGVDRAQVLHVGDHVEMDVAGAMRAGLRGCWINREGHAWAHQDLQPDLEFDTLTALADWLDATQSPASEHSAA